MLGNAEAHTAQGEPPPPPSRWIVRVAAVSKSQEWEAGKGVITLENAAGLG